jgi:hypothetical protein
MRDQVSHPHETGKIMPEDLYVILAQELNLVIHDDKKAKDNTCVPLNENVRGRIHETEKTQILTKLN